MQHTKLYVLTWFLIVVLPIMHQSIPPAASSPPPRPPLGLLRGIRPPCQSGGEAFANFALPGGRAFANPGAIPELLTRTQFPIRVYYTAPEGFTGKK